MRLSIDTFLSYELTCPTNLLLAVEVAQMHDQILVTDRLSVTGEDKLIVIDGEESIGRRTWTRAEGHLTLGYTAIVDVNRIASDLATLQCEDTRQLPALVVPYLFPSRYCEADRFRTLVQREFGGVDGGAKVQAIAHWIREHLSYTPGASDQTTTSADTFMAREGVCRDFAHLMIAMVRAADIPARIVGAYAWNLAPEDFHAVVEVWLEGAWHLVDPTGLAPVEGIVRIGVGRDATDISFMTVFGRAAMLNQRVSVTRLND
jgi:transglutaminase-like putative cysteine protease